MEMLMSRTWGMPSGDTFDCEPIAGFVKRYLSKSKVSVDPFARNNNWCTWTNDLNPDTSAQQHVFADTFLLGLKDKGIKADLLIFDPPYSPRQISELYSGLGIGVSEETTQNGLLYRLVRTAAMPILTNDAIVCSFGWNSAGMGKKRGFEIIEILLVSHGGAHNDTICMAEQRTQSEFNLLTQGHSGF